MAKRIKNLKNLIDNDSDDGEAIILISSEDDNTIDSKLYPIFKLKKKTKKRSKDTNKHELTKKLSTISISDDEYEATTSKNDAKRSKNMDKNEIIKKLSPNSIRDDENEAKTSKNQLKIEPSLSTEPIRSKIAMCAVCNLRPKRLFQNFCKVCETFFINANIRYEDDGRKKTQEFSRCKTSGNCLETHSCVRCRYEACSNLGMPTVRIKRVSPIFNGQGKCEICNNPQEQLKYNAESGKEVTFRSKVFGMIMCQSCRGFTQKWIKYKLYLSNICSCKTDSIKITRLNRLECLYCRYYYIFSMDGAVNPNDTDYTKKHLELMNKFRNNYYSFVDFIRYRENNKCTFCKEKTIECDFFGYDSCKNCRETFYRNINKIHLARNKAETSKILKPYFESGLLEKYKKYHEEDTTNYKRFEETSGIESDNDSKKIFDQAQSYYSNKLKFYDFINNNLSSSDPWVKQVSTILDLMIITSFRPGFACVSGKGLFSLEINDITLEKRSEQFTVIFDFTGKCGIHVSKRSFNIGEQTFKNLLIYQAESTNNKLFPIANSVI